MAYVGGLDVGGGFAVLIVNADVSLAGGELAIYYFETGMKFISKFVYIASNRSQNYSRVACMCNRQL